MDYEDYEKDRQAIASAGAQIQKSINSRLGKLRFRCMKAADFDAEKEADGHSVQQVTFVNRDGDIELWLGDIQLSFGGGYDGPVIETGVVLAEDQLTDWAPARALLPVDFRGDKTAYYSGVPAHFVVQGQRCYAVPLTTNNVTEDDVLSEITFTFRSGEKHKLVVYIYKQEAYNLWLGIAEYDVSGATPTLVATYNHTGYWILPQNNNYPYKIGFSISLTNFYMNNEKHAPRYWINMWCFANGSLCQYSSYGGTTGRSDPMQIYGISGLFNNHANVDFANAAEEHFAYGLVTRTEPVYPEEEENE